MKRFHFRLQPLLLVRDLQEKRAREAFLVARQRRIEASENLSHAQTRGDRFYATSLALRTERLGAGECVRLHAELERAQAAVVAAIDAHAKAREVEESVRAGWVEARRQLKVIQRLRENALSEYGREALRLEQGMLDELAMLRASTTSRPLS